MTIKKFIKSAYLRFQKGGIIMEQEKKHEEHHKKTHYANKHKKIKKITMWQGATLLLGVLLVISILTQGFSAITGGPSTGNDQDVPSGQKLIILSDERCDDCNAAVSILKPKLQEIFTSFEVEELDYSSEEGKAVYESTGVKVLPAVLFTEGVKSAPGYDQISGYLDETGDLLSLRIGATFNPEAEICTNGVDDNNDGTVDCNDPQCSSKTVCREEMKGRLDVFVMSQCPYGTKALDAMEEVLEAFGDDIDFHINYIATETAPGQFNSLHGQPEVDENIRELCAISNYPDNYKYMDYIWCRDKDIRSDDWEPCAAEAKMSASMISNCFIGDEGTKLHSDNIKLAQELGIGASPTWLANNKFTFSGIDAETVKSNFCKHNPGLKGCGETLSTGSDVPAGQC